MGVFILIIAGIILFIVLSLVFKKGFLIPLISGMGIFVLGLIWLLNAMDHLKGAVNWLTNQLTDRYENYLLQKNAGIVCMVIGGILLLLGIIFAIKSGSKSKEQNTFVHNYYGGAGSSAVICGSCGQYIPAGTKFCPECGAPAGAPDGSPDEGSESPEKAGDAAPQKDGVCPGCGEEFKEGAKFCTKCGRKF